MIDLRLRTRIADDGVREIAGRVLGPRDFDLLLTGSGPVRVRMPDNRPLCVYLPAALSGVFTDDTYRVLHAIRAHTTSNRGDASGTRRLYRGTDGARSSRSESMRVASAMIGTMDPMGQQRYCRLSSWTGRNLPDWELLHPPLRKIGELLQQHVPDRWAAQMARVINTHDEWVIPGTPFSTVTVNNTYPTGVHTDKGDLDEGYSTIACLRRGTYTGGQLVFPAYRLAVDLRDGDLLLMDAHQWHGNVPIVCACGTTLNGPCKTCTAERISVVSYYRTKVEECGTADEEHAKASALADSRHAAAGRTL